jgi:hypothetical protein
MRFEGKNKIPKAVSKNKMNFIKISKTVAYELTNIEALDAFRDNDMHPMFDSDFAPGPTSLLDGGNEDYVLDKFYTFLIWNTE